jgi:hypothetical protein
MDKSNYAVDHDPVLGDLIGHEDKDSRCWRFSVTCSGWYPVGPQHCPDMTLHQHNA